VCLEGKTKTVIEMLEDFPIGGGSMRHHCVGDAVIDSFPFTKEDNRKYYIVPLDDIIHGVTLGFRKGVGGVTFEQAIFNLLVQCLLGGGCLVRHACLKRDGGGKGGDQRCVLCHRLLLLVKERGNGWVDRGAGIS